MTSENQATSAQHQVSDLIHPYSVIQSQREGIASLSDDETSAYALHGFVATVEGQLSVIRGDKLLVLDDCNTYWWLVKRISTSESGYVPAENIETPFERLARFNKIRNTEIAPISISEATEPGRSNHKRVSIATKISIQYMVIHPDSTTHITETYEESRLDTQESPPRISDHVSSTDLTRHFIKHHTPKYRILRVFAGNLSGHTLFKSVLIHEGTTGAHLLRLALERFQFVPAPSSWVEYYLTIQQGDGGKKKKRQKSDGPSDTPPLEERRMLPYDKPFTMAIPSVRFFLNKRIKCMHDHEVRIKIAYYTPCTKWYDRHTKADRIEKVVAVPAAATITDLTTLALQKFHLRHGVPYTCSTGAEKYGMTVLLQGKGKSEI
ncbi:hypothetical protein [Absidia glauca]|uniref:SH3 domain-containing protein n=1 Tax=Absidia glauca TaxID=4829 RepID=A0A163JKP6_ABSGL|nr:hypothetical protein [Absidia glauca]